MISSPQKHVGDNLSCQLQRGKKEKIKGFRLKSVIRHWKFSKETAKVSAAPGFLYAMQVYSGGVHSVTHWFGFLPVSITKCWL